MTAWTREPVTEPGVFAVAVACLLGLLLFALAVVAGRGVMCWAYEGRPSPPPYCSQDPQ